MAKTKKQSRKTWKDHRGRAFNRVEYCVTKVGAHKPRLTKKAFWKTTKSFQSIGTRTYILHPESCSETSGICKVEYQMDVKSGNIKKGKKVAFRVVKKGVCPSASTKASKKRAAAKKKARKVKANSRTQMKMF